MKNKRSLKERFYNHKYAIIHQTKTTISEHFNLPNHTHLDVEMIAIDQINDNTTNADYTRRSRESMWQKILKTYYPFGLNSNKFQ